MYIALIFFIIIVVSAIFFFVFISRSGQRGEFTGSDSSNQMLDQITIQKREDYFIRMKARQRAVNIIFLVFIAIVFSFPFFLTLFDTLSFQGKLDAERYDARMKDSYLLLGGMAGLGMLFFFLVSWLMNKMTQNYRRVILSLDQAHFEKMIDVNQSMNMVDGFMLAPPFIIGQSSIYVFKLGRVLAFPWTDITNIKITSAPRSGFFVRMKVWEKIYFFSIGDRTMMNILEAECVHRGIPRS
ncbi:hypothetical protein [Chryseobacterium sp. SIMBA_028]|uniref:hypothetical protein n=1 Tax=Chryseobacterium sp. SIMBA_028 TaxID=3085771 RepID=UPI00397AD681